MKALWVLLLQSILLPVWAVTPQFEKKVFTAKSGNELLYRVLYPENYDASAKKKYPLVLFLHGGGERGTDNEKQLMHGAEQFLNPVNREKYPAIVLFPQCPPEFYWALDSRPEKSLDNKVFPQNPPLSKIFVSVKELLDKFIADERVDFRQLIKVLAEAFRVRIEMKQIGARQEAGRIGGIGPCGRELCCATWMTSFVSVSTSAARFQDISLNPQKLAGQCAKLKCCLNYEVDCYVEAQKRLPSREIELETKDGTFYFFKADILSNQVSYSTDKNFPANLVTISGKRAFEVISMNKKGMKPDSLLEEEKKPEPRKPVDLLEQESVTRFDRSRNNKEGGNNANRNNKKKKKGNNNNGNRPQQQAEGGNRPQQPQRENENRPQQPENGNRGERDNRPRNNNNNNRNRGQNQGRNNENRRPERGSNQERPQGQERSNQERPQQQDRQREQQGQERQERRPNHERPSRPERNQNQEKQSTNEKPTQE